VVQVGLVLLDNPSNIFPVLHYILEIYVQDLIMDPNVEEIVNTFGVVLHSNSFVKKKAVKNNKHFIFDLDETLGSFGDLYILWCWLLRLKDDGLICFNENQTQFNALMDIYPEFLRYGIMTILEFLFYKKLSGKCGSVYIYTNNQCYPPWVNLIIKYLESTRGLHGLFEPPICALKINNCIIDPRRTTFDKTHEDFIKCSLLPRQSEIFFLDNTFFPKMNVERVYYVQPLSYHHSLSIEEMIQRFQNLGIIDGNKIQIEAWFYQNLSNNPKTKFMHDVDIAISKRLMYLIKDFFSMTIRKKRTSRVRFNKQKTNVTRKIHP
jgi:hypothetical protein